LAEHGARGIYGHAVGRLLRDQREARALSIEDVAKRLRIRRPYLEAIEQGRFDQLPGAAYIPAFLRAYAAHLDLDAEKVLTAYQASGPGADLAAGRLPADFRCSRSARRSVFAVLTVLLVVGAGYAVWHYLPRQESTVAQKVPPVPDRLLASHPASHRNLRRPFSRRLHPRPNAGRCRRARCRRPCGQRPSRKPRRLQSHRPLP
jgi:cytoskeleton protein RodZ